MTELTRTFSPDWISPPGDTIADLLEERDWTQVELANRLGCSQKYLSQLINGKAPLTEDTALKLERVLGSTTKFWLSREAQYRAQLAKNEEKKHLEGWVPWLKSFPVKELMNQGKIPKRRRNAKNNPSVVKDLLQFFEVASPKDWESYYEVREAQFRRTRSRQSDVKAIASWLRCGEIEFKQEQLACAEYSKTRFEKAVKEARKLTVLSPEQFKPELRRLCRESGVVLVFVPVIPRTHTSGAARWLNRRPLIQLSLYGKTNDRFWFTFFHEAAHILLHDKKDIFLDEWDQDEVVESKQEIEANQWARELLIPPQYEEELRKLRFKKPILTFADKIGLHPGIVVGRLQHEKLIDPSWHNDLKQSFSQIFTIPDISTDAVPERLVEIEIDKEEFY